MSTANGKKIIVVLNSLCMPLKDSWAFIIVDHLSFIPLPISPLITLYCLHWKQYLKVTWWCIKQTCIVSSSKDSSSFTYITCAWGVELRQNVQHWIFFTSSYKKKLKSPYVLTKKCPDRHKNFDYWYLLYKYSPDTQNFGVFFTSWMKSLF